MPAVLGTRIGAAWSATLVPQLVRLWIVEVDARPFAAEHLATGLGDAAQEQVQVGRHRQQARDVQHLLHLRRGEPGSIALIHGDVVGVAALGCDVAASSLRYFWSGCGLSQPSYNATSN